MALARVKVWVPLEVLSAADLNTEFNNILNNPTALISPFTANLNANGKQITNLALENLGASPAVTAAGRIWFNTASSVKQVEIDDGSFIRTVPNILATSMSPGDILYAVAGSSQGGNPSWARLASVTSSQAGGVPLVQTTSAPAWGTTLGHKWVTFNGVVTSSQITPLDASGVSTATNSIIRTGGGNYTIPWSVPFANAAYSVYGISMSTAGNANYIVLASGTMVSSQVSIQAITGATGNAVDSPYISVVAIGRV